MLLAVHWLEQCAACSDLNGTMCCLQCIDWNNVLLAVRWLIKLLLTIRNFELNFFLPVKAVLMSREDGQSWAHFESNLLSQ